MTSSGLQAYPIARSRKRRSIWPRRPAPIPECFVPFRSAMPHVAACRRVPDTLPSLEDPNTTRRRHPVSSPQRHNPPVEVRERAACMCDHGDSLLLVRSRARAAPDPVAARRGDAVRLGGRDRRVGGCRDRRRRSSARWRTQRRSRCGAARARRRPRTRRAGRAARALPRARGRARALQHPRAELVEA